MAVLKHKNSVLEICEIIAEKENLKVTVNEAVKGGLIVGGAAFAGALLGGPIGLAVCGTAASALTAWRTSGKYRSVVDIIRHDLTPEQQRKLESSMKKIMDNVNIEDVAVFLSLALKSDSLKEVIVKEMGAFLLNEFKAKMIE